MMPKWLKVFFPKKYKAITVSKDTAWYVDFETLDNQSIRKHEEVHMDQFERYGWFSFVLLYVWYSIRYGYWDNPLEVEARELSK